MDDVGDECVMSCTDTRSIMLLSFILQSRAFAKIKLEILQLWGERAQIGERETKTHTHTHIHTYINTYTYIAYILEVYSTHSLHMPRLLISILKGVLPWIPAI